MTPSTATAVTSDLREPQRTPSIPFRIGWWVLVALTCVLVANHALGFVSYATSDDERALFLLFFAFGALSLTVLVIPYRRLERWSWWATWIPVVVSASPVALFPLDVVGMFYAGVAVVMAGAQLTTARAFGRGRSA